MTFEKDKVYQMKVKRTDFFNGRRAYIAEYEGAEYRINMYAHQSPDKTELSCVYIGENSLGKPQFQQEYASVLSYTASIPGESPRPLHHRHEKGRNLLKEIIAEGYFHPAIFDDRLKALYDRIFGNKNLKP